MAQVNFMAVLVAALSSFLLGGLWYSKALFGEAWNRAANANPKHQQGHPARVFGVSFLFALVAAFVYAWLVPPAVDAGHAAVQGLLVGAGMVAASFGINYQFANRGAALWLIDGGYHTLQFLIFGLIIGLWR
jgi:hypothetical protein